MIDPQPVWLTPQAYQCLRSELAALTAPRPTSADAAEDSGEQVLSHQEREARIRQLRDVLDNAVVGQDPPDDGVAEPGMVLTVRYDDTGDVETFLLGTRGAEDGDIEVYSPNSPLGTAVLGANQGEQRTYTVPSGATVAVTLLRAVPYGQHRAERVP